MQPDTWTLSVDAANDGNPSPQVYTRSQEFENRSVYIGASHALDQRDTITLYRSWPTKNGNFKGVQKTAVKFTQDIVVAGVDATTSLTSPIIAEISFSIPVGATAASIKEVLQRVVASVDDDAIMDPLTVQLLV